MVSKRLIVASVAIAAIVVVAGLIYFVVKPPPQTAAESMILTPQEIGEDWIGFELSSVNIKTYPNQTSFYSKQVQNQTIGIGLIVYVFETNNDSLSTFTERTNFVQNDPYYSSFTHFSIGDDLCYFELEDYPAAYLLLDRTMTVLWSDDDHFSSEAWYNISTLEIASLQADKIDRYLAEHPGAN